MKHLRFRKHVYDHIQHVTREDVRRWRRNNNVLCKKNAAFVKTHPVSMKYRQRISCRYLCHAYLCIHVYCSIIYARDNITRLIVILSFDYLISRTILRYINIQDISEVNRQTNSSCAQMNREQWPHCWGIDNPQTAGN